MRLTQAAQAWKFATDIRVAPICRGATLVTTVTTKIVTTTMTAFITALSINAHPPMID
jgi:hypothetical protein